MRGRDRDKGDGRATTIAVGVRRGPAAVRLQPPRQRSWAVKQRQSGETKQKSRSKNAPALNAAQPGTVLSHRLFLPDSIRRDVVSHPSARISRTPQYQNSKRTVISPHNPIAFSFFNPSPSSDSPSESSPLSRMGLMFRPRMGTVRPFTPYTPT